MTSTARLAEISAARAGVASGTVPRAPWRRLLGGLARVLAVALVVVATPTVAVGVLTSTPALGAAAAHLVVTTDVRGAVAQAGSELSTAEPPIFGPPIPAESTGGEPVGEVPGTGPTGARGSEAGQRAERTPGVEYDWPLAPVPEVVRPFDEPPFRYGRGHRGADLAGEPGQAVLAARDGEVAFAGPVAGRGVVSVQHEDGLRTTYEPVTGTVAVGVRVRRGDPIGVLEGGHPGCAERACLHWGVRRGAGSTAEYLDPLVLLRPRFVRLYPLPEVS